MVSGEMERSYAVFLFMFHFIFFHRAVLFVWGGVGWGSYHSPIVAADVSPLCP